MCNNLQKLVLSDALNSAKCSNHELAPSHPPTIRISVGGFILMIF